MLRNGGFETVTADNKPEGWILAEGHQPGALTEDTPHGGKRAARIVGDGKPRAWRQESHAPATRIYQSTGWFRARGLKIKGSDEYARFYFHILYKDRPYADTTHVYADIPPGTYDWKRMTVRLVPQVQWPIDTIRVTVATRFTEGTLDFDDISLGIGAYQGGANALEWTNGLKTVVLSDMAQCQPANALAATAKSGHWKTIRYEAGDLAGTLIWAADEASAPTLTLPLNTQGWHAVYVGLADPAHLGCRAMLKLTNDAAFVPRARTAGQIEEIFFKVADLSGQSLQIAQASGGHATGCGIAYVKLVPLTPAEVALVQNERRDASHRRLATTIDGFSFIYSRRPTSQGALLPEVETYRNSDFDTLILQMGGADMVNYPSKVGEMRGQDTDVFGRKGDRFYAEAIRNLAYKGINPTKTLIDGAHDAGMKVHVAIRPAAWMHSEPLSEFFNSRFYQRHPEWRCVDRDGTPVVRMSLAVPQVRAHLIEVLREAVRFGADGANIIYARGVPLVLFEKPFGDLFRQRHGAEATSVDENDPRILQLRADLLTTFMREARAMLDEEAARRPGGKRLELSAFVLANEEDNAKYGIDVRRWAAERLVDQVFPYVRAGGTTAKDYDMRFFNDACKAKKVRVRPTIVAWTITDINAAMERARELYEAGADGITFWDGNSGADQTPRWSVISRMGHIEELRERAGAPPPSTLRFRKLADVIMDGRYSPNWGY